MASLTIYLDDETLKAVENAAKREGSSVSKWARTHLAEASKEKKGWPPGYFERIESWGDCDIEEPPEIDIPLRDINFDED